MCVRIYIYTHITVNVGSGVYAIRIHIVLNISGGISSFLACVYRVVAHSTKRKYISCAALLLTKRTHLGIFHFAYVLLLYTHIYTTHTHVCMCSTVYNLFRVCQNLTAPPLANLERCVCECECTSVNVRSGEYKPLLEKSIGEVGEEEDRDETIWWCPVRLYNISYLFSTLQLCRGCCYHLFWRLRIPLVACVVYGQIRSTSISCAVVVVVVHSPQLPVSYPSALFKIV